MKEWLSENFTFLVRQLADIQFTDVLDILLVSVALFYAYRFIRERRAGKLALGVVLFGVVMILADILQMHMTYYFLNSIFRVGVLMVIILFQPEIRSVLEKMGTEPIRSLRSFGTEQGDNGETYTVIREVCEAAADFSAEKTGALIIFERQTKLGDIVKTGTVVNADVTSFLLKNIFYKGAPMHDGATIISENRVYSAGCFLPLSLNNDIIKDLGTRHRAGIGMSENSDAVVVIVSEETGGISVAIRGDLTRGYDKETLAAKLEAELIRPSGTIYKKLRFRKGEKTVRNPEENEEQTDTEDDGEE